MIYEGPPPTWGPALKYPILPDLYLCPVSSLHLTPYVLVHLLNEHGNSRSEVSNVSISFHNHIKQDPETYRAECNIGCHCNCTTRAYEK